MTIKVRVVKLINFKLNRKLFPIHPTNGFDLEQSPTLWKKKRRRRKKEFASKTPDLRKRRGEKKKKEEKEKKVRL